MRRYRIRRILGGKSLYKTITFTGAKVARVFCRMATLSRVSERNTSGEMLHISSDLSHILLMQSHRCHSLEMGGCGNGMSTKLVIWRLV